MNAGSVTTVGLLTLIIACVWFYEGRRTNSREIALIVSLAAVSALSRVPFAGLPSIQPTTFLVLCSGLAFGPFLGCAIGASAAWISNLFLVQGPWTLWQMIAWGLVGFTAGWAGYFQPKHPLWVLLGLGFLWGFLFGWIMNFWYWVSFAYPLNWASWISINAASFVFDAAHALGNVAFVLLFGKPLLAILVRFKGKLHHERRAV